MKNTYSAALLSVLLGASASPIAKRSIFGDAPSRWTNVWITNQIQTQALTLTDSGLSHGEWSDGWSPPSSVPASGQEQYMAESNGLWTGDEGYTTYTLDDGTVFAITFDNPQDGSNSYSCDISGDNADQYTCTWDGGDGDNAAVSFTIALQNIARPTAQTIYVSNPGGTWSMSVISSNMDQGSFVSWPSGVASLGSSSFQVQSSDSENGDSGSVTYQLNQDDPYGNAPYVTATISFSTDAFGNVNYNCGGSDGVFCNQNSDGSTTTNSQVTSEIDFQVYYYG